MNEKQINPKFILGLSIFLYLVAFLSIVVVAYLQSKGYTSGYMNMLVVVLFFVLSIVATIILNKNYNHLMLYEMQHIDSKYDQLSLSEVRFLTLNEVEEKLQAQDFKKLESLYYEKRKFSFFRDSIHYHVRCIQSINAIGDIEKETRRFEKWSKKPKNSILILIVYADQVSDSEFKFLKHKSKLDIISAKISKNANQSIGITVLVDKRNYDGYYLDIYPKQSISNYGYACRFVKKQLIK